MSVTTLSRPSSTSRTFVAKCEDGAFRRVTMLDPSDENISSVINATVVKKDKEVFGWLWYSTQEERYKFQTY